MSNDRVYISSILTPAQIRFRERFLQADVQVFEEGARVTDCVLLPPRGGKVREWRAHFNQSSELDAGETQHHRGTIVEHVNDDGAVELRNQMVRPDLWPVRHGSLTFDHRWSDEEKNNWHKTRRLPVERLCVLKPVLKSSRCLL